jgi:hypothetical protein
MIRAAILTAAMLAPGSPAIAAQSVRLTDATVAPSWLRLVQPHRSAAIPLGCAYRLSDVSAYRWNGHALGAQRWTADHLVTYWTTRHHRRVTFDGRTFRNRTRSAVIVAAWCES